MSLSKCGAILLVGSILAGCATAPTRSADVPTPQQTVQPPPAVPVDPEARLRIRVAQYWDARVRGDLVETYQLHEPAFRRAVTLTAFLQGRGATTVFEYVSLGQQVQDNRAVVQMKIRSTFHHSKMIKPVEPRWNEFHEQWVWVDGEWYRKYRFPTGDPYPSVNWDDVAAGRAKSRVPVGR